MKKFIKNNLIGIIIGGMIFGTVGVIAATTISSKNVTYQNKTVNSALDELYNEAVTGKELIAAAITNKGVTTTSTDTYETMATNINTINTVNDDLLKRIKSLESKLDSKQIFLMSHPIDSIYITISSDENTTTKMSQKYGGKWSVYGEGKFLLSSTENVDKTGGNNQITLNSNQIPSLNMTGNTVAKNIVTGNTGTGYGITYGSSNRTTVSGGGHSHGFSTNMMIDAGAQAGWGSSITNVSSGYVANPSFISTTTNGNHTHTYADYYVTGISGVATHNHSTTVPSLTVNASYVNSNQTSVNIQNSYITVYMYKRTA